MRRPWWFATNQGVFAPVGLILAAKDGIELGPDWSVFTAANDKFLRGTDSDAVVGTTGTRYGLSVGSGGGGAHTGSQSPYVCDHGYSAYTCANDCRSPSNDPNTVGAHSGHVVSVNYRPSYVRSRLIRCTSRSPIPLGSIMFGDTAHIKQSLYSPFNNYPGRLMYGSTVVGTGGSATSVSVGSVSDAHDHVVPIAKTAWGIATTATWINAGGGAHNHSAYIGVSANINRCAMRAFEIIDNVNLTGLIGMWAQTGVPDNWEVVAVLSGRFLTFSATAAGEFTGDNRVSFSGSLSNRTHSHAYGGSLFCVETGIPHSSSVAHNHSFGATRSYLPERYNIKFIRFTG